MLALVLVVFECSWKEDASCSSEVSMAYLKKIPL